MKRLPLAVAVFWLIFLIVHVAFAEKVWHWTPDAPHHRSIGVLRQSNHAGTAFLCHPQYLATAEHVVDKGNRAAWDIPGGNTVLATVVFRDRRNDVALLRLDHPLKGMPTIPLGPKPPVGANVEICGYGGPMPGLRHFHSKVVSDQGSHAVSHSSLLNGDSGGPVIYNGQAVGIVHGGENVHAFAADDYSQWRDVYPARWYYPTPIRNWMFGVQGFS